MKHGEMESGDVLTATEEKSHISEEENDLIVLVSKSK